MPCLITSGQGKIAVRIGKSDFKDIIIGMKINNRI